MTVCDIEQDSMPNEPHRVVPDQGHYCGLCDRSSLDDVHIPITQDHFVGDDG